MALPLEQLGGLEQPRQPRSQAALAKLLMAGEQLLEEGAFESASVAEIAARAGSSVGSFYRLIGDKDRLLGAIHSRFLVESHALLDRDLSSQRFVGRKATAICRAFVTLLVDIYARREGLLRALIIRSSAEPEFRDGVHSLNDALERHLTSLLTPHRTRIGHPRPKEAIHFGVKVVLGALNQSTLVRAPESRDRAVLIRELSRVLTAYLALEND